MFMKWKLAIEISSDYILFITKRVTLKNKLEKAQIMNKLAKYEDVVIYHANGNVFALISARKGSDLHKLALVAKVLKEKYGWTKRKIAFVLKPGERPSFHASRSFDDILHGLEYTYVVSVVKKFANKQAKNIVADISNFCAI